MTAQWISIIIAAAVALFPLNAYCVEQQPYRIKDQPNINRNFEEIFFEMATHNHGGEDSAKLGDVLPSSASIHDIGSSTERWQNVHVSSSVEVSAGTMTSTSGGFYCKTSSTGYISKSENGSCWALRVNNDGSLFTAQITCPN